MTVAVYLTSCSKVFFKTNYEKVKTFFHIEGSKVFCLLWHKIVFCSILAYSCSALTEVINPLYMDGIMHKWANQYFDDFEILGVLKVLTTSFI